MPLPRLLWVTAEVPDRALGGGNIRQAHLLAALAGRFEVTVLAAGPREPRPIPGVAMERVWASEAPPRRSALGVRAHALTVALTRRGPTDVHDATAVRAALRPRLEAEAPRHDLVLLHHLGLTPLARHVDRSRTLVAAHLFHVVHRQLEQRAAASGTSALGRRLLLAEARRAAEREQSLGPLVDACVCVSTGDARAFPGVERIVAPNGVDVVGSVATPVPAGHGLVFIGTLSYEPNVDGLVWFCHEVLPLVRAAVDDASLTIVGRRPTAAVRALGELPGVVLVGPVDDARPHLETARAAVVPLRIGTGTRLKALEAMAAGRPVVGTSIGLEGLGIEAGRTALVADAPADLAAACERALTDDRLADTLAATGRGHVEREHAWPAIGHALADDLVALLSRRGSRPPAAP